VVSTRVSLEKIENSRTFIYSIDALAKWRVHTLGATKIPRNLAMELTVELVTPSIVKRLAIMKRTPTIASQKSDLGDEN